MNAPSSGRALVTGAGGFIGSHLAAELHRRGSEVVALDLHLDRVRHLVTDDRFIPIEADVADPDVQRRAVVGVDTVYHLAAAHLTVAAAEGEFRRVNVEGVRTLVEACRAARVRRFVHCSSVGVYGTLANPPADEETPCRPEIAYERTKLEGEQRLLEAVRAHGFPAVIVRPVWVYGPGCPRTEKLFRSIGKGRFLMAGRGDARRHCIYIRDMIEAFVLASQSEAALGRVVIVGDAEAATVRELLDEIARLTGARSPLRIPVPLLWSAGLAAEIACKPLGKEPPLSRRTLKFFTGNTAFDISRAKELLGFEPRYDLRSGLEETQRILGAGGPFTVPLPQVARG